MQVSYRPKGVCSREMIVDVEDGIIKDVQIKGGCDGNLKGICELVKGHPARDVIDRISGIHCGPKATSCPDQLAIALRQALDT